MSIKKFISSFFLLPIILSSCSPSESSPPKSTFSPLQNGFGVVVQAIGIDSGPGAKLYYKGTNVIITLVWPYIGTHGYPILYTNNIALLLADKPDSHGYLGNGALIVIQGTGPAMDISDEVLKIAAEQNHVDFDRALKVCEPLRLNQVTNALKVLFYSKKYMDSTIPDLEAQITWEQVFAIMEDVKKTGETNKVVNTDVRYLQKDYGN